MARKKDAATMAANVNPFMERLVHEFGEAPRPLQYFITSGIKLLDLTLSGFVKDGAQVVRGIPLGQTLEIFGPYNSGKTALINQIIKVAQSYNGYGCLFDGSKKYNWDFAELCGVNTQSNKLEYWRYRNLEDVFDAIETRIRAHIHDPEEAIKPLIIAIDDFPAINARTSDEIYRVKLPDGKSKKIGVEMQEHSSKKMCAEAQCITNFLSRSPFHDMATANIVLLIGNQQRDNVETSVYARGKTMGLDKHQPGGNAVKHAAMVRLSVAASKTYPKPCGWEYPGDNTGIFITYTLEKNQLSAPYRSCTIPFDFRYGFDDGLASYLFLLKHKVVEANGGYFPWQGKNYRIRDLRDEFATNPVAKEQLNTLVQQVFFDTLPK